MRIVLTTLVALVLAASRASSLPTDDGKSTVTDLTTLPWTVYSDNVSLPARIPSQAHLDLLAAGIVSEPTYGDNEVTQAWVAVAAFTYRSSELATLQREPSLSTHLIFDGIDTFAEITFCDQHVAQVDNQFRQWRFDVTELLANCSLSPVIEVKFRSAPAVALDLMEQAYEQQGNSCISCYGARFRFPGRQFIRKEQNDFGWDWGPGLAPQGIWQPARIVQIAYQEEYILIQNVYVDTYRQGQVNNLPPDQSSPWVLNVSIDYLGALADEIAFLVDIRDQSGALFESIQLEVTEQEIGRLTGSALLTNMPDLWWPVGHGNQTLYSVSVSLLPSDGKVIGTADRRIGFRTIVLNQTPISPEQLRKGIAPGGNWHFEVNGREFYAKGSNIIPPDPFWPRVTEAYMETLFESATAANQNMLRVWSSSIYFPDYAYDLADQLGLLLWSELQFSAALYPNDTISINGYVEEVSYQVRRLNHHPSLALWCGGNELELALQLVSLAEPANLNAAIVNYESIFLDALLHAVFDNTRSISYISSSVNNGYVSFDYNRPRPIEPRYTVPKNGSYYSPSDYYNYNVTQAFSLGAYPVSRFANEFGIPSQSSYKTYSASLPADQLAFNSTMIVHRNRLYPPDIADLAVQDPKYQRTNITEKSLGGLGIISQGAKLYYPLPNKADPATNFSMQIYATQLFQAEFVRSQIDFYRRGSGLPQRTLGSLYWQLNDIWASPTWAGIEVTGRWKLLHHIAGDAYSPVVIAPFLDDNGTLSVSVTSDLWHDVIGHASITWYDWLGTPLHPGPSWTITQQRVSISAINSTSIWSAHLSNLPETLNTAVAILQATLSTPTGTTYTATRFYTPYHLSDPTAIRAFRNPHLTVSYDASTDTFTVSSRALAAFVWLDHPLEVKGYFDLNGFWMLPGLRTVRFISYDDSGSVAEGWQADVTVQSVFDLTTS